MATVSLVPSWPPLWLLALGLGTLLSPRVTSLPKPCRIPKILEPTPFLGLFHSWGSPVPGGPLMRGQVTFLVTSGQCHHPGCPHHHPTAPLTKTPAGGGESLKCPQSVPSVPKCPQSAPQSVPGVSPECPKVSPVSPKVAPAPQAGPASAQQEFGFWAPRGGKFGGNFFTQWHRSCFRG